MQQLERRRLVKIKPGKERQQQERSHHHHRKIPLHQAPALDLLIATSAKDRTEATCPNRHYLPIASFLFILLHLRLQVIMLCIPKLKGRLLGWSQRRTLSVRTKHQVDTRCRSHHHHLRRCGRATLSPPPPPLAVHPVVVINDEEVHIQFYVT